jgi:FKBP-type peptidyl-prolyl cis-trans isomerase FkpA
MRLHLLAIALLLSLLGCTNSGNKQPKTSYSEAKKKFETVNKALVDRDREKIDAYIQRHNLVGMQENKAGLYYLIWGEPNGPKAKLGDIVVIDYKITLLDGTLCFDSKVEKPKDFLVGKGGVEAGLEMAILLMQQGQKGKFIMPPHLGHGLLGDNDKIPPLAVLVFDVELLLVIES